MINIILLHKNKTKINGKMFAKNKIDIHFVNI
jgi:hypothetical protein